MKQLLFLLFTFFCTTALHGQGYSDGREKIAVYVTGGRVPSINKTVGNRLVSTIVKQGKYTAVERSAEFLAQLQKEYGYQRSGNVDAQQISRVGKQFGVDIVCVAEIMDVLSTYDITMKLIDVETAEIMNVTQAYSKLNTIDNLTATAGKLAAELFGMSYRRKQKGVHLLAEALYLGEYGGAGIAAIGYRFNEYVALGAGGGYAVYSAERYKGTAIPVFADLRVNILPFMLSPYVAVAGGVYLDAYTNTDSYTFNGRTVTQSTSYEAVTGYYNVAAGLYLRCSDVFAVHAGAGYNNIVNSYSINAGIAITFVK
jgi:hypothetical protein